MKFTKLRETCSAMLNESISALFSVYKRQGRDQHELMTRGEFFAEDKQVARGPRSYKKVGQCFSRRRLRRPTRRWSNSVSIVVGVLVAMWWCSW